MPNWDDRWKASVSYSDDGGVVFNPAQLLYVHGLWFAGRVFIISILHTAFMLLQRLKSCKTGRHCSTTVAGESGAV